MHLIDIRRGAFVKNVSKRKTYRGVELKKK
jgi:hypothetical protein